MQASGIVPAVSAEQTLQRNLLDGSFAAEWLAGWRGMRVEDSGRALLGLLAWRNPEAACQQGQAMQAAA